jgi:hypothetical protein
MDMTISKNKPSLKIPSPIGGGIGRGTGLAEQTSAREVAHKVSLEFNREIALPHPGPPPMGEGEKRKRART